jgi:hypothetical protein
MSTIHLALTDDQDVTHAARRSTEMSFLASDGQEIFYRVWRPLSDSDRAVMLFCLGTLGLAEKQWVAAASG